MSGAYTKGRRETRRAYIPLLCKRAGGREGDIMWWEIVYDCAASMVMCGVLISPTESVEVYVNSFVCTESRDCFVILFKLYSYIKRYRPCRK